MRPRGDSKARAPPNCWLRGGERPCTLPLCPQAPEHPGSAATRPLHAGRAKEAPGCPSPAPTRAAPACPPFGSAPAPAFPRERAETLTLAGAAFAPPAGPAPRPGGGRGRRWRCRWGGLARWVRVPRVGTGGETTPPRRPLPERARRGWRVPPTLRRKRRREARKARGPLTCPPSLPHLGPAGGLGQVLGSAGNLGREPKAAGVQAGPARTWEELAGCPRRAPTAGVPPKTAGLGEAPALRKNPRQEGGWCKSCRGRRSQSQGSRSALPHPRATATPPCCCWGAPGPPKCWL